ncbi:MAG: ribbon-helix-helix protein CopG family [Nocardioidaceae bacterium]|nr:ribbon-helix-helix protein CopG family [Nocardioidaceae bacterium]
MAMTLRTDPELQAALRMLAAKEGISQQEVVRRAVLERASNRRENVRDMIDVIMTEDADLLDRLAQ